MLKKISSTERWFTNIDFIDNYNNEKEWKKWTLRKCSHANSVCFWLYVWDETIHIDSMDMAHIADMFNWFLESK